jgi:hypothetical protein
VLWDKSILNALNGIVYAYSWYLDIACKNWEALVSDDYKTVMPLTGNKKYGFSYLFQPFFIQQLGVFSSERLNERILNEFLAAIPAKYRFVEINLNIFNNVLIPSTNFKKNLTHELDLIPSYTNLQKSYSENTRRNIKKAETEGITISKRANPEEVIKLFRKYKGREIKHWGDEHYKILLKLMTACMQRSSGYCWGAYSKEKKLMAGAFFADTNHKVIFLFSAAHDEARKNGAMSYLIDRFIHENAQRNLTLEFEGSNNPNLARFYKSFGSKECVYLQFKKNNLPWFAKLLKK